jgi:putative hydrolase of the HAD superfamily
MIHNVKHIIFDLGGVLLDIDYSRTEIAFNKLGINNFGEIYSQLQQTNLFDEFEMGKIEEEEFIQTLKAYASDNVTDEQITEAWNAMLLNFSLQRLQLLNQLRIYYDLVLLSNTNSIHEAAFTKILKRDHNTALSFFFDKVYYSHKIGLRKPMKEIFEKVLADCNFIAEQTLFIDDSPQHIKGAKEIGIQTIFLEKGMTIEKDIFKRKA